MGSLPLLAALWACTPAPPSSAAAPMLESAALTIQGGRLYLEASLSDTLGQQFLAQWDGGGATTAEYRFLLHWRPSLPAPYRLVGDQEVRRMVEKKLILERYEMREGQDAPPTYSSDPEDALRFFTRPRFIPLESVELEPLGLTGTRLTPGPPPGGTADTFRPHFRLETRFLWRFKDLSQIFRILGEWMGMADTPVQILESHHYPEATTKPPPQP
ncbi:MAG: hypothetical protein H7831_16845 [Magnetococcus sp. WYHC-3]